MSTVAEIEAFIQDTTHMVGEALIPNEELATAEPCLCSCGMSSIAAEGSAAILKKCEDCFEELQREMFSEDSPDLESETNELDPPLNASLHVESSDAAATDSAAADSAAADSAAENDRVNEPISKEALEGALVLAMTDSAKSCTVALNGEDETFTHYFDPISGSKTRKLFKRASWEILFRPLYWYIPLGAMISNGLTLVTPCMVKLKNSTSHGDVLLYALFETMCNRPRYDGLCVDLQTNEVFIVQNIAAYISNVMLELSFDRTSCNGIIMDFLNRGRWFFDPARGLKRSCKNPQRDDSALKKYWTKERIQLECQVADNGDTFEEPANVEKPAKAKSGKAANKGCKKGRSMAAAKVDSKADTKAGSKADCTADKKVAPMKIGRKPIVIYSSDEEQDEADEEESEMDEPLPPKKARQFARKAEAVKPLAEITNILPTASIEAHAPSSVGTDVVLPNQHSSVTFPADPPAVAAETTPGLMQLLMTMAYDSAAVNARKYDLDRREQDLNMKQRFLDEQADRARFLSNAEDVMKRFLPRP